MDTAKSVEHRHSHLWLYITANCVLEVARTQLAISSKSITVVTTSRRPASISTQNEQAKRVGWSDHGKSPAMFRLHDQTAQLFCYKMMVKSAFSWKVSEIWKSKSRPESVMIPSSSL